MNYVRNRCIIGHTSFAYRDVADIAEYYGEQVLFNHKKIINYKKLQKIYKSITADMIRSMLVTVYNLIK